MPSTRRAPFLALCLAFGCSRSTPEPAQPAPTPAAPTPGPSQRAVPPAAHAQAPAAQGETRGVVRETMNSGGYTYMRLETAAGERWVATTEMPLRVGDSVTVEGGSVMNGFRSRTLDRTFDSILFAGSVRVAGAGNAPAHPPVAPSHPGETPPAPPAGPALHGTVRETMNSAGYTYLRVENAQGSTWAAVPQTAVAVGDVVDVMPGNEMPGFRSRTLDRTFPQLTFSPGLRVAGAPGAAAPAPATGALPPGHPPH